VLDKCNQCDRIKVTQAPVLLFAADRGDVSCAARLRLSKGITNVLGLNQHLRFKANPVAAFRSGTVRGGGLVTQPERLGAITTARTFIHYPYWVQGRAGRSRHGIRSADTVAKRGASCTSP
jgi:hypothetical protein